MIPNELQMYLDFRKVCDTLSFPMLREWGEYRQIKCDGEVVGFLMVIEGYVEGIYVKPEYRRKGLARKAVLEFMDDGGYIDTLHIIKTNETAQKFWESIFHLVTISDCPVDTLYRVIRRRETIDRDCPNCTHHINGSCEKWECEFERRSNDRH